MGLLDVSSLGKQCWLQNKQDDSSQSFKIDSGSLKHNGVVLDKSTGNN